MVKRNFNLEDIQVQDDIKIVLKLRGTSFARTLLYLTIKFEDNEYIHTKELTRFLKCSHTYAFNILDEFQTLGLLSKTHITNNLISWTPVKNSKHNKIDNYIVQAKKTLGLP